MGRKSITEDVKRRLYAESMGRCMNPDCQMELFINDNDIIEKAHIIPYRETENNSYENLIILCPNCHKMFDKINLISKDDIKQWKDKRKNELKNFFSVKFNSFNELKEKVVPILSENYSIYNNYYLGSNKDLWNKFEPQILSNNEKLKLLFEKNLNLFQHFDNGYSNLEVIRNFIIHVDEFKNTRCDEEKIRKVVFPSEINSIFGIKPVKDFIIPSTEALEVLIKSFKKKEEFEAVVLGVDEPYILLRDGDKLFLDDTPRLRQLYFDNGCFRKTGVRLKSLNFALKYLNSRGILFEYNDSDTLRQIRVNCTNIVFVYEYCLSKKFLYSMAPKPNYVIVNLHNWNGECCISTEALNVAEDMNVKLLTMDEFYRYVNEIK